MAKLSPVERALRDLRDDGWHAEPVEAWQKIDGKWRKKDLLGIADVLAWRERVIVERTCFLDMLFLQVTDSAHFQAHVRQVWSHANTGKLIMAGAMVEVWGLRKSARTGRYDWRKHACSLEGNRYN